MLAAPLRTLAQKISPVRIVIDQGGHGQCGPNTLSFSAGLAGRAVYDGPQLRAHVEQHSRKPEVLDGLTSEIGEAAAVNATTRKKPPPNRGQVELAMQRALNEHGGGGGGGPMDNGSAVAARNRFRAEQQRISRRLDVAATMMTDIARKLAEPGKMPREVLANVDNALLLIRGTS